MTDFIEDTDFTAWAKAYFLNPEEWDRAFTEDEWKLVLKIEALPVGSIGSFDNITEDDEIFEAYNNIISAWLGWQARGELEDGKKRIDKDPGSFSDQCDTNEMKMLEGAEESFNRQTRERHRGETLESAPLTIYRVEDSDIPYLTDHWSILFIVAETELQAREIAERCRGDNIASMEDYEVRIVGKANLGLKSGVL